MMPDTITTQAITLALPALEPGAEPPAECPCCGVPGSGPDGCVFEYDCDASYKSAGYTIERGHFGWEPDYVCDNPSPSAVLRAAAALVADRYPDASRKLIDVANVMRTGE